MVYIYWLTPYALIEQRNLDQEGGADGITTCEITIL